MRVCSSPHSTRSALEAPISSLMRCDTKHPHSSEKQPAAMRRAFALRGALSASATRATAKLRVAVAARTYGSACLLRNVGRLLATGKGPVPSAIAVRCARMHPSSIIAKWTLCAMDSCLLNGPILVDIEHRRCAPPARRGFDSTRNTPVPFPSRTGPAPSLKVAQSTARARSAAMRRASRFARGSLRA